MPSNQVLLVESTIFMTAANPTRLPSGCVSQQLPRVVVAFQLTRRATAYMKKIAHRRGAERPSAKRRVERARSGGRKELSAPASWGFRAASELWSDWRGQAGSC